MIADADLAVGLNVITSDRGFDVPITQLRVRGGLTLRPTILTKRRWHLGRRHRRQLVDRLELDHGDEPRPHRRQRRRHRDRPDPHLPRRPAQPAVAVAEAQRPPPRLHPRRRQQLGPKLGVAASDNADLWGNMGIALRYWFGADKWSPALEFTSALSFKLAGTKSDGFQPQRSPVGIAADIGLSVGGWGAIILLGRQSRARPGGSIFPARVAGMSPRAVSAIALVHALLGCSSGSSEAKPEAAGAEPIASPEPAKGGPDEQPEPSAPPEEGEADKSGEAGDRKEPAPSPPVEVEPTPAVAVEPGTIPVSPVKPITIGVAWREAASPPEPVAFVYLIGGILGKGAKSYYDLDDGGALALREVEPPHAEILGYWPDNAWYIERGNMVSIGGEKIYVSDFEFEDARKTGNPVPVDADERGDDYDEVRLVLKRLSEHCRCWLPEEYDGEEYLEEEQQSFAIGGKGGLLVYEHDITRVDDGAANPELGVYPGFIVEFMETRSGRIYTISRHGEQLYAQRNCKDKACSDQSASVLPFGLRWTFSMTVPRQRHSVSLAAVVEVGRDPTPASQGAYLLHYETGGWKLESLPESPSGLWPTKDGGLWARVGGQLWHRDPNGGWRNIDLPEGMSGFSVAMRRDQSELWISGMSKGNPVVLATHANAQDPAPAPADPTDPGDPGDPADPAVPASAK